MMASTTPLTLADLKIGGSVLVMGTVSRTSIVAKTVIYGVPPITRTAGESKGGITVKSSLEMPAKN
jgi:hypothetical protein